MSKQASEQARHEHPAVYSHYSAVSGLRYSTNQYKIDVIIHDHDDMECHFDTCLHNFTWVLCNIVHVQRMDTKCSFQTGLATHDNLDHGKSMYLSMCDTEVKAAQNIWFGSLPLYDFVGALTPSIKQDSWAKSVIFVQACSLKILIIT